VLLLNVVGLGDAGERGASGGLGTVAFLSGVDVDAGQDGTASADHHGDQA
jgi:hypothetical protein